MVVIRYFFPVSSFAGDRSLEWYSLLITCSDSACFRRRGVVERGVDSAVVCDAGGQYLLATHSGSSRPLLVRHRNSVGMCNTYHHQKNICACAFHNTTQIACKDTSFYQNTQIFHNKSKFFLCFSNKVYKKRETFS